MSKWIKTTLAKIADIRVSNVDKKSYQGEKPVMLCNYMDVYSNDYITRDISFMEATANIMEVAKFTVSKGDVLITKDSETPFDIGIPAVVEEDIDNLICGYHLAQLRPDENKVDSVFLAKKLAMPDVASYFSRVAAGSTRYGLSNGAIANTSINLPPLDVQRKISDILKTIDNNIKKTEVLIDKYRRIKKGMMHDLFTRGLETNGRLRPKRELAPELYKETPLGWIPNDWIFSTCSNVCEKIIDCKNRTPPLLEEGYPVIRTPNVRNGEFVTEGLVYTDFQSFISWTARGKPIPGDIVITREAPVGEVCKIPSDYPDVCLGQRMMLYRTDKEKIDNDYFLYVLQSDFIQKRLDLISGGSTVGHVRVGDIKELWIVYPMDKGEQRKIAASLNAITKKITSLQLSLVKIKRKKNGIMSDLLTGKVSVQSKQEEIEAPHV